MFHINSVKYSVNGMPLVDSPSLLRIVLGFKTRRVQ